MGFFNSPSGGETSSSTLSSSGTVSTAKLDRSKDLGTFILCLRANISVGSGAPPFGVAKPPLDGEARLVGVPLVEVEESAGSSIGDPPVVFTTVAPVSTFKLRLIPVQY